MIQFREKLYSEYDAMRYLYTELRKNFEPKKIQLIDSQQLIPVLKGNSVVIEKFTINKSFLGKETYRLYLKIGLKAKLPDKFRLPSNSYQRRVGDLSLKFNGGLSNISFGDNNNNNNNNNNKKKDKQKNNSIYSDYNSPKYKLFAEPISAFFAPNISFQKTVTNPIGETIKYDKNTRTVVLEFKSVEDVIKALKILPIGLDYKLYLSDD